MIYKWRYDPPNLTLFQHLPFTIPLPSPPMQEAGDAVVELLAQKCDATEKRSVDEVHPVDPFS